MNLLSGILGGTTAALVAAVVLLILLLRSRISRLDSTTDALSRTTDELHESDNVVDKLSRTLLRTQAQLVREEKTVATQAQQIEYYRAKLLSIAGPDVLVNDLADRLREKMPGSKTEDDRGGEEGSLHGTVSVDEPDPS